VELDEVCVSLAEYPDGSATFEALNSHIILNKVADV